jgi:hypothetical protein
MYEKLLDNAIQLTWMKSKEELGRLKPLRDRLFYQWTQSVAETIPVLLNALRTSDMGRVVTAIEIIDFMGYPKNEFAIPELLACIGSSDPNGIIWAGALFTLSHIGQDILVPHIIRALLETGEPYHHLLNNENNITSWEEDLEGLCTLLSGTKVLERTYARQCCPAINSLLMQISSNSSVVNLKQIGALLWVVEEAGNEVTYVLPTLIALAKQHQENEIGKKAKKIIYSFSQEALDPYKLILFSL